MGMGTEVGTDAGLVVRETVCCSFERAAETDGRGAGAGMVASASADAAEGVEPGVKVGSNEGGCPSS
jgi:hypothetical protein